FACAAGDGGGRSGGPLFAAVHPRPHLHPRRHRRVDRGAAGGGGPGPPGRAALIPPDDGYARYVKILAAMSGGVDSAVAAAPAVAAPSKTPGTPAGPPT